MSGGKCRHPAADVLVWYLQGSLEGDEEQSVGAHVEGCEICSRELRELAEIADGFELHGVPDEAIAQPPRRALALAYAAAAVLLVPAILGLYWVYLGLPTGGDPRMELPVVAAPAVHLDLGAGATRGGDELSALNVPDGVDVVSISLLLPGVGRYNLELLGPDGRVLAARARVSATGFAGRSTNLFPARLFGRAGEYAVVLSEDTAAGVRTYRFTFVVGAV